MPCSGTPSGTTLQQGVTWPNPLRPRAQNHGPGTPDQGHCASDHGPLVLGLWIHWGRDCLRWLSLFTLQFQTQPCHCSCRVASTFECINLGYACNLMQVLITRTAPPKIMPLAVDLHEHLIQVPLPVRATSHLASPFPDNL